MTFAAGWNNEENTMPQAEKQKAMRKARFQQSKDDVLRVISELIGADPKAVQEAA